MQGTYNFFISMLLFLCFVTRVYYYKDSSRLKLHYVALQVPQLRNR